MIPTHQGFGTQIIERMIGQLKGTARFDWRAEGLICEITLRREIHLHAHRCLSPELALEEFVRVAKSQQTLIVDDADIYSEQRLDWRIGHDRGPNEAASVCNLSFGYK